MCGYPRDMTSPSRSLTVQAEDTGRRLDLFLAEKLALSRAQVRRLLASGAVELDGRRVGEGEKGARLSSPSSVAVAPFARREEQRAIPDPRAELVVLAQGPGWLAVDKPAGTPVHPLREDETGSVLNALIAREPGVHGVGEGGLRSGVVHRLDVDTSGALLVATRPESWERLRRAFAEHRVEKVYRALVLGRVEQAGKVELPLVTARHRPARVRVAAEHERARGARISQLSYQPLEIFAVDDAAGGAAAHRLPAPDPRDARSPRLSRRGRSQLRAGYRRDRRGAPDAARRARRLRGDRGGEPGPGGFRGALRAPARRPA